MKRHTLFTFSDLIPVGLKQIALLQHFKAYFEREGWLAW
ncbi:hypothetical protein C5S39_05085 [Candidatus Methanophagaceae archaeon]|jgi:hypothetical protein|nr:hypothetical protein C5S39_05085 [Methanophagales archaeon]